VRFPHDVTVRHDVWTADLEHFTAGVSRGHTMTGSRSTSASIIWNDRLWLESEPD
jgi:hypothetical protein